MPNADTSSFRPRGPSPGLRIDLDPDDIAHGFAQVVVAVAEILRELLERQAIRRLELGDLDTTQIERLGGALLEIRQQLAELRENLGNRADDVPDRVIPVAPPTARTTRSRKDMP
jgi:Gas vesicle protein K